MDEMRNSLTSGMSGSSGQSSAANTVSKSLGAELLGKMKGWGMNEEAEEAEEDAEDETGDETEGEDVIQTIITRKKRKVASRANTFATRTFEELKEYSDSSTQYDPAAFFVNSFTQTSDVPTRTTTIQTDDVVVKTKAQVEKEKKVKVEMEIQTEEDSPPTPKAKIAILEPTPIDQPPAYTTEEEEWRRVAEVLRKYHPGLDLHALQSLISSHSVDQLLAMPGTMSEEGGIPEDLLDEWKSLKSELGVECLVIDKILASAAARSAVPSKETKRRSGRFYNIYNTYVYGSAKGGPTVVSQTAMFLGVSAFFLLALTPYLAPPAAYSVPGGPSYYDRQAWGAFNGLGPAGEGLCSRTWSGKRSDWCCVEFSWTCR